MKWLLGVTAVMMLAAAGYYVSQGKTIDAFICGCLGFANVLNLAGNIRFDRTMERIERYREGQKR